MKFELSNREFRTLLEMLVAADWLLHSHEVGEVDNEYTRFQQKFFKLAKKAGCEDLVEYHEVTGQYDTAPDLQSSDKLQQYIDRYDEASFWQILAIRLGVEELRRSVAPELLESMPRLQRVQLASDHEARYAEEFEKHGLERLRIVKDDR